MSLGFTQHRKFTPKTPRTTLSSTDEINDTTEVSIRARSNIFRWKRRGHNPFVSSQKRLAVALIILNICLSFAHSGIIVWIVNTEFRFPLTFFYTRFKESLLSNTTCIFEYGSATNSTRNSFCSDPSLTQSGNSSIPDTCVDVLRAFDNYQRSPAISESGGPLLEGYELTRFGKGSNSLEFVDDIGRQLAKGILLTIEGTTAVAHILYSLTFIRLSNELNTDSTSASLLPYILHYGGLPLRWIEYAITSSLMALFIANVSNLYEIFGLVSLLSSNFALMFIGASIELLVSHGMSMEAFVLFYVPGMAIFFSTWAPIVGSLSTSVFELSCKSYKEDSFLSCSDPTCFGREIPILLFSTVLFSMFTVFPLILILKLYILSGWFDYLDMPLKHMVGKLLSFAYPIYIVVILCLRLTLFALFACFGWLLAIFSLTRTILSPFLPAKYLVTPSNIKQYTNTILISELLFAFASATSKIFLASFFISNFAPRNW